MKYHNITHDDMNNGDGLRVVLWLSGCSHHCKNCQNPMTWNPEDGIIFDENAEKEIFKELDKDYISGITFSGGDPLNKNNLDGVLNVINKIQVLFANSKSIWIYSGYTWDEIFNSTDEDMIKRQEIISKCDVFIDGRYKDDKRDVSLKWRGSKNQKVIDVKKTIKNKVVELHCD